MTEYDYSPEAAEAYTRKLKGIGRWAQDTSRYNGDFTSPFEHTPSATRRRLDHGSSTSSSGSDSDSGFTSYSRRSRPLYPKSLTAAWPGTRSRAPPPRPLQVPPPQPPALGQRPPPTRSHTLPTQIYIQNPSPAVPQAQPQYPYATTRPGHVAYYNTQQPVMPQQQQQQQQQSYASPTYYAQPTPKRSNTTPSQPLGYQYYGTPINSAGASPYGTPVPSPYGSATYPSQPTSPRGQGKNWLSRMFGALSIRGRSSSPAPRSYNSAAGGQLNYEPTMRHTRSRSLGPPGYRTEHERDRERESAKSDRARRSRSTRSTRPSHPRERYSDESDRDRGHRRQHDRSREGDRDRERHHRRARSLAR